MVKMITDRMTAAILFSLIMRVRMNWTRAAIALALLCAVFSFSVAAQDNSKKPLDAEAASALRQELIDGLPDLIEDEAQVTAITEKWKARRNLAGRTREEILETLYLDTESIISDPDLRDSIWKAWTTDAETDAATDEEAQVETPPKPSAPEVKAPEKPMAVPSPKNPLTNISARPSNDGHSTVNCNNSMDQGTVKYFIKARGFGLIKSNSTNKEIFVHKSGLVEIITTGDQVQYCTTDGVKGITAVQVKKI